MAATLGRTTVLAFAAADLNLRDEEVALTVPVEAFEHYEDWLTSVAEAAGMPRFRLKQPWAMEHTSSS